MDWVDLQNPRPDCRALIDLVADMADLKKEQRQRLTGIHASL